MAITMVSQYSDAPQDRRPMAHTSPFEIQDDQADGETLAAKYQMLEELGSGSFGVVYKAIEKETGEIVAIKHVRIAVNGNKKHPHLQHRTVAIPMPITNTFFSV